jgi:hypothetical protein
MLKIDRAAKWGLASKANQHDTIGLIIVSH